MTERERLIWLLKNANAAYKEDMPLEKEEFVADFLLGAGVIALRCKVGDTVYVVGENDYNVLSVERTAQALAGNNYYARCQQHNICNCDFEDGDPCYVSEEICQIAFCDYDIGREVFLTREEAEKALKERENK